MEPPFELIVERLCAKYGWKPSDVMEMDMDWVNTFLDISLLDDRNEWKQRKRQQIKREQQKHG